MIRLGVLVGAVAVLGSSLILTAADPTELTPQQRQELEKQALALSTEGVQLHGRGQHAKATELFREALAIRQRLYPRESYPQGHPDLATSLNNLAALLHAQGDYARAEPLYREALQIQ
jgi:tetratricopeptide (TPR) repeat protein